MESSPYRQPPADSAKPTHKVVPKGATDAVPALRPTFPSPKRQGAELPQLLLCSASKPAIRTL